MNDTLDRGQTNSSATFGNDLLTLGVKTVDDNFDIHNIELFTL